MIVKFYITEITQHIFKNCFLSTIKKKINNNNNGMTGVIWGKKYIKCHNVVCDFFKEYNLQSTCN